MTDETRILLPAPSDTEVRLRLMEAVWPRAWDNFGRQLPDAMAVPGFLGYLDAMFRWVKAGERPAMPPRVHPVPPTAGAPNE